MIGVSYRKEAKNFVSLIILYYLAYKSDHQIKVIYLE